MNLDELRSVQRRERDSDDLQELRDSFYEEVGDYIAELKAQRDRVAEQADNPFSNPEVTRLSDEINTAEDVASSIYDRRIGKIVDHASLAAADYTVDTAGLTTQEEALFETIVEQIQMNKETVLELIKETEQDTPTAETSTMPEPATPTDNQPTAPEQTLEAAAAMGTGSDNEAADSSSDPTSASTDGGVTTTTTDEATDVARTMVRITDDVGEIMGIDDRTYDLTVEDVVTLPEANATPLIEQGAAERLQ